MHAKRKLDKVDVVKTCTILAKRKKSESQLPCSSNKFVSKTALQSSIRFAESYNLPSKSLKTKQRIVLARKARETCLPSNFASLEHQAVLPRLEEAWQVDRRVGLLARHHCVYASTARRKQHVFATWCDEQALVVLPQPGVCQLCCQL